MTGQRLKTNEVQFQAITSSPIGLVHGQGQDLENILTTLSTEIFPFHAESNIAREAWSKTIINAVFNSICPLLNVDNGIFIRDASVLELAREIVQECLLLAAAYDIHLNAEEILERILKISHGSQGILISTLQDLRAGRPTEIESLNLALSRRAAALTPSQDLPRTRLLGQLILAKSRVPFRE